jgi:molecular chaperone DnaK
MANDNKSLGRFILDGILPAPRGVPQIEVMFDLDTNGILNVSAKDKATGKEQKITITASSGLSKEEVEKLQREAEMHAAEDQKRRDEIETRNQADTLAYSAERTLREHGDKVPSDLKSEVESNIAAVRSALQGTDADELRRSVDRLNESMQKIGQAVYASAGAGGPGGPADDGQSGPAEEGTVEGEFREV